MLLLDFRDVNQLVVVDEELLQGREVSRDKLGDFVLSKVEGEQFGKIGGPKVLHTIDMVGLQAELVKLGQVEVGQAGEGVEAGIELFEGRDLGMNDLG